MAGIWFSGAIKNGKVAIHHGSELTERGPVTDTAKSGRRLPVCLKKRNRPPKTRSSQWLFQTGTEGWLLTDRRTFPSLPDNGDVGEATLSPVCYCICWCYRDELACLSGPQMWTNLKQGWDVSCLFVVCLLCVCELQLPCCCFSVPASASHCWSKRWRLLSYGYEGATVLGEENLWAPICYWPSEKKDQDC